MEKDATLDAVGLFCPVPIVNASEKIAEMKPGEVLEILADDEGIKEDLPAWCETTGNEFLGIEEEGGIFKGYVRKK